MNTLCLLPLIGIAYLLSAIPSTAQQVGDPDYNPEVTKPAFPKGGGPVVAIDDGHQNFHTRSGRYAPFARLLKADGYRVRSHQGTVSKQSLSEIQIYVIVNALHQSNQRKWELPTPSAFSDEEIDTIVKFVAGGGSLFLIADHMPFPGAIEKLAAKFGVQFENGFNATKNDNELEPGKVEFRRKDGGIAKHVITDGDGENNQVDQVTSFTGSVFRIKDGTAGASPLLVLGKGSYVLNPKRAWKFAQDTEKKEVSGWLQGAAIEHGKGRVVVFAEAAMFTAQRSGKGRMGMHAPGAKDNQQLARNILRWLSATPPK